MYFVFTQSVRMCMKVPFTSKDHDIPTGLSEISGVKRREGAQEA
jgi:hypothetical protein